MKSKSQISLQLQTLHNEVTGSCTFCIVDYPDLTTERFALDCGFFQHDEEREYNTSFPFQPSELDFVVVSHNHFDHTGRLPLLVKEGFHGAIYTSEDTEKLLSISLPKAKEAVHELSKKLKTPPLYSPEDIQATLGILMPIPMREKHQVTDHIWLTFFENGHVPGAVITLLEICFKKQKLNFLFTGDYNPQNVFLKIRELPPWVKKLPNLYVLMESTYGSLSKNKVRNTFSKTVASHIRNGFTVFCPAFAFSSAQKVLYAIKQMQQNHQLDPSVPIYLDGKQAIAFTELFASGQLNLLPLMEDFRPENLHYVSSDNRKEVMESPGPKIIVSSSGNASRGAASLYLPSFAGRSDVLIHFTGHLFEGSTSYELYHAPEGTEVTIGGQSITKRAKVASTHQFSGHAKQEDLIHFLKQFRDLNAVFLNHGEVPVKEELQRLIRKKVHVRYVCMTSREYSFRLGPTRLYEKKDRSIFYKSLCA